MLGGGVVGKAGDDSKILVLTKGKRRGGQGSLRVLQKSRSGSREKTALARIFDASGARLAKRRGWATHTALHESTLQLPALSDLSPTNCMPRSCFEDQSQDF